MAITLRSDKGLPLTYTELDDNFSELNDRINTIESGTAVSVNGQTGNVVLTTTEINEGNNLYYTNERVDARLANLTTNSLPEGTRLYYTDARVRNAISAGTGLTFSTGTGVIALAANTSIVSEGTNLYYTNDRVDSRLAATSINALSDVNWSGTPTLNYVMTWTGSSWEPAAAPGASGGEANEGVNLGSGQGLFAGKAGVDLRFYTIAGSGISVSAPSSNVITLSIASSITTSSVITNSNGNLNLTPNGTGIVIASNLAVSSLTSGRITYSTTNSQLADSSNLTFDGTTISAPVIASTIADGTAPFVVTSTTQVANLNVANAAYATSAGSATSATSATTAGTVTTAAQPNITSVGNLTIANIDNIQINGNTISSTDTNGNIYLTPSGSGEVIVSSLAVSDLTTGRVPYVNSSNMLIDSANLTFNGTTFGVIGNANVSGVAFVGNLRLQNNHIEANDANGNLILTPNGTGRLGVGTTTPATLLDVNGTVTSTGLTVNGSMTLGASSANTITLTGRFGSSLLPSTSASYDLGSSTNRFRAAFLSGNLDLSSQIVSSVATGTAPLVITSTTQVANLNVATAGTAGTVTTAAQPNITSVGTLTSLGVNGTITGTRLISNIATGTAPLTVTSTTQVANLNVATAGTAGTVTTAAQPNITSVGTLTSLAVSGSISDSTGKLRAIPQNAKTTSYTLIAADSGKHISTNASVIIPNTIFSSGDTISIFNNSAANITIDSTTGAVTTYMAGTANTGNRTLTQRGLATVMCVAANTFVITGAGLV